MSVKIIQGDALQEGIAEVIYHLEATVEAVRGGLSLSDAALGIRVEVLHLRKIVEWLINQPEDEGAE